MLASVPNCQLFQVMEIDRRWGLGNEVLLSQCRGEEVRPGQFIKTKKNLILLEEYEDVWYNRSR